MFSAFITCPKGLDDLLLQELRDLGLQHTKQSPAGVYVDASLETIYRVALWSRIANRLLLTLGQGIANNSKSLYQTVKQIPWPKTFKSNATFKVLFHGHSTALNNAMYAAQVVKDAVVDNFREHGFSRPNVAQQYADVIVHAYLKHDHVTIYLDLVGYSLHQRGYRQEQGMAPLKENLAAALLLRMKWPELVKQGRCFADLMCGSGTLVIEAAMMAMQIAPGLLREDQAFHHWLGHQEDLWSQSRAQAKLAQQTCDIQFLGNEVDPQMLTCAKANAYRAGVAEYIDWKNQPMQDVSRMGEHGLLLMNPPYGERMGTPIDWIPLYQALGLTLYHQFQGWQVGILCSESLLVKAIGLRSYKQYAFYNGALPCQLYCFTLDQQNRLKSSTGITLSPGAQMLANRLDKNWQHLKKWALRQAIDCYRVYDADLPEYAFAIDKYADYWVVQEYMPPQQIPPHVAANRRLDLLQVVPQVFGTDGTHIILKERAPQKEQQYQKLNQRHQKLIVKEAQARFYVNLYDYLDTGLFLDHRLLRLCFSHLQPGTRFLNLFCYTAAASVHAGLAGCLTLNVDLSNTYLTWATENFQLNHLEPSQHRFIQADVMLWLQQQTEKFDVIYMDTPSFSNSKRMQGTLDIQRDHKFLISLALSHLNIGGSLYFSTHLRSFKLDAKIAEQAVVQNITRQTIDLDFKRNSKMHTCYLLKNKPENLSS